MNEYGTLLDIADNLVRNGRKRPKPIVVNVRLKPHHREIVDALAKTWKLKKSQVILACLEVAWYAVEDENGITNLRGIATATRKLLRAGL